MKMLIVTALLSVLATNAFACERSPFAARLIVYDKFCTKLPVDYLVAYSKESYVFDELLTDARDEYKSNPAFCQGYAKQIEKSVTYYKKHGRIESC
jgi:hypothetical protein